MSEEKKEASRLDWIRHRNESGYDWVPLLEAVSKLRVYWQPGGILVDASEIAAEHMPAKLFLTAGPNGYWKHWESGVLGPLVEHLFSIALMNLEAKSRAEFSTTSEP